jgi:predicted cytidylate kinase
MIITISGFAGSGKTTVAKGLAEKLKYKYLSAGALFREEARKNGLSLEQFLEYAEKNPRVDRELDRKILELAKQGNIILEGRLVGWLVHQQGLPSIRVWLETSLETRAKRLMRRENKSLEEIIEGLQKRESSDWQRFWDLYTINLNDLSVYSLIIDTNHLTPSEIISRILQKLQHDRIKL